MIIKVKDDYYCGKVDINTNQIHMMSAYLYVDYIFLEDAERKKFCKEGS